MNIGVSTGKAGMFVTVHDGDKMVQIDPRDLLAQTRLKMFYQLKPEVQRMLRKQQRRPPRLNLGRRARRIIIATDAIPSERLNTSTHGLVGKSSPTRATHFFHCCSAITHDHP
jgi:hypothetical protein